MTLKDRAVEYPITDFILPSGMQRSPFFNTPENVLGADDLSFAYVNQFPVTAGHILILPKREVVSALELTRDEIISHMMLAKKAIVALEAYYKPDGYIIGWNINVAGGQSVAHAHLHIIPRYNTDNEKYNINPRGGILRMPFIELGDFYNDQTSELIPFDLKSPLHQTGNASATLLPHPVSSICYALGHAELGTDQPFDHPEAVAEMFLLLHQLIDNRASQADATQGYNIGWNLGISAGQIYQETILHVIERQSDDTSEPRGGITKIFPTLPDYYAQKNAGQKLVAQERVSLLFDKLSTENNVVFVK